MASAGPIRSIAVLPLENLSGDPEQEYFADGMTDALIGDLAKLGSLKVISRTSVMQYKGQHRPLAEIAQELNVDAVIEGTVLRAANRVRITAQLIDARSDHHLWSERYDRELSDVLALQSEVARAVAHQIQLELTPQEEALLGDTRPVNPEAHDFYIRGINHLAAFTPEDTRKAAAYFEQAIQTDGSHALSYSGLARAYYTLTLTFFVFPPEEGMTKMREAALKALELDDTLALAHASLGSFHLFYDWDFELAEKELGRAVQLHPGNPDILADYATAQLILGHHEKAIGLFERAMSLAPTRLPLRYGYCLALYFSRDFERSLVEHLKLVGLAPDFRVAYLHLALTYWRLGREAEAVQSFIKNSRLASGWSADAWERGYAEQGTLRGAARSYLQAATDRSKKRFVSPSVIGLNYAALGDPDPAFKWLERAYTERDTVLVFVKVHPMMDPVRSDPRFQDLLRRIGFPESQRAME